MSSLLYRMIELERKGLNVHGEGAEGWRLVLT
jgi:hypothetical protein